MSVFRSELGSPRPLVLVCDWVQVSSILMKLIKTILGLFHSQAQSQSQTQHVPYVPLNHCHPATVGHWHQRPILERHGPLERVETSLSAGRAQVQARARRGAVFFWQMGRNLRILLWNWGINWKNSHLQNRWMFWTGIPRGIPIPTYGIWWAGAELREVLYGDLKRPLVLANAVGLLVRCDLMRNWYNEDVIDDINNIIIYNIVIYIYREINN